MYYEDREGNTAVAAVTPRKEEDDSKDSKDDDEIEEIEDDIQGPEENHAIKIDMNEIYVSPLPPKLFHFPSINLHAVPKNCMGTNNPFYKLFL